MAFLRWTDGPGEYGSTYHKRAVHRLDKENEDLIVDLVVTPLWQGTGLMSVTVGRYRDYRPTMPTRKWQTAEPDSAAGRLQALSALFDSFDLPGSLAASLADEVEEFIALESAALRGALDL